MKVNRPIKKCLLFFFSLLIIGMTLTSCHNEKDSSRRRVEREKARKEKESDKKYKQILKQHEKNQSASTRTMMKKAKKDSPKNTPLKKSSGKKCKQK